MHIHARTTLALAAAALIAGIAATSPGGCGPTGTSSSGGGGALVPACDTFVDHAPRPARLHNSIVMQAQTHSVCDRTPQSHHVTLTFQHRAYGSWATVGHGEPCEAIPYPGNPVTCQVNLFIRCATGRWRVKVLIAGVGPDGRGFSLELPQTKAAESIVAKCPHP